MLANYSSIDIAIDLHRDASKYVNEESNKKYTTTINGEKVAQICFVVGMKNENVDEVMKTATELTNLANEMYPGLFKPMIVRNSRYNQHLGNAACIIEVGATGNTLEQCITSMKYLAKILNELK